MIQPVQARIAAGKAARVFLRRGKQHCRKVFRANSRHAADPNIAEAMKGENCLIKPGHTVRYQDIGLPDGGGLEVISVGVQRFRVFKLKLRSLGHIDPDPRPAAQDLAEIHQYLTSGRDEDFFCRQLFHGLYRWNRLRAQL